MDVLLHNVDNALCSSDCPCDFTNSTGFQGTLELSSTYVKYNIKNNKTGGVVRFQNCSNGVKNKVSNAVLNMTFFGNFSSSIELLQIFEDNFNCSGWCKNTYDNPNFNITQNTCMNSDRVSVCNCTDWSGDACSSCVDKKDNRTACTNYISPKKTILKYLLNDINR
jgi:hypothetical protein